MSRTLLVRHQNAASCVSNEFITQVEQNNAEEATLIYGYRFQSYNAVPEFQHGVLCLKPLMLN